MTKISIMAEGFCFFKTIHQFFGAGLEQDVYCNLLAESCMCDILVTNKTRMKTHIMLLCPIFSKLFSFILVNLIF